MMHVGQGDGALLYVLSANLLPSVRQDQTSGLGIGDGVQRALLATCYVAVGLYHVGVGDVTGGNLVVFPVIVGEPGALAVVVHVYAQLGAVGHVEAQVQVLAPTGQIFNLEVYLHMSVLGVTKIRFFAEPCPDLVKKQGAERFSTDF